MNIARHMELTIMKASKNFKSNRLSKIFGRSNGIFKSIVKYMNQLGMSESSISVRNYLQVYSRRKELTVGTKDSRDIGKFLWYLVITRATWNEGVDSECMYLSIGIYR